MATTTLAMLEELEMLADLDELSDEDVDFVETLLDIVSANGDSTLILTDEQVDRVVRLYGKYC